MRAMKRKKSGGAMNGVRLTVWSKVGPVVHSMDYDSARDDGQTSAKAKSDAVHAFACQLADREGKKKSALNAAQAKEVVRIADEMLDGLLYPLIQNYPMKTW